MAREADVEDRRASRIRLTLERTAHAGQGLRVRRVFFDRLLEGWNEADLATFASMLGRFADSLEQRA